MKKLAKGDALKRSMQTKRVGGFGGGGSTLPSLQASPLEGEI